MDKSIVHGVLEAELITIKKPLTYTVKIDIDLPFKDNQIGVVIINDIEYMKKVNKTVRRIDGDIS